MTRVEAGDPLLASLALPPEGEPDPVSLAAVLAAHRGYVRGRGTPDGVSLGALAIARLLAWAQRATMLGRAPQVAWVGPEARRPADVPGVALIATATVEAGGARRSARAVALVRPPGGTAGQGDARDVRG
ncbi:MAG TPA: hypothetical protein VNT51_10110 [Miltoncostaeaceae bacterium]|nr:hypothetical protein [Miltoncostaeaceae bacterium]